MSRLRARFGATMVCLVVAAFGVGCGGSESAGAKSPSTAPQSINEPSNTGGSGSSVAPSGVGAQQPAGDKEPSADGMIVDDAVHAQIQFDDSHKAFNAASGDCASMCKALSSMQRAADHLCGLTKDGSDSGKKRCDDAQAKVDGAKERVKATCGGCG